MIPTDELEDYPKRTSSRPVIFVIGAIVVAALVFGVLMRAPSDDYSGREVPSFDLALLDGGGRLSDSDPRGKPVVLNFWASWCGPCLEEMPLFEKKWREYRGQGLTFVGVVVRDTEESALRFIRENDITYPIVWDPDQTLARGLGVDPLPETFFIDGDWRLISGVEQDSTDGSARTFGVIDEDQLQDRIDALLGGSE